MVKIGRLLLISIVWLGLLWLGATFAPRLGSADVFAIRWADSEPPLPRAEGEPRQHHWSINGQAVQAEWRQTALSVRQALDRITNELTVDPATDPVFALQRAEGSHWGVLMQWRNPQRRELLEWLPGLFKVASPDAEAYAGALIVLLALENDQGVDLWTLHFDANFDPRAWGSRRPARTRPASIYPVSRGSRVASGALPWRIAAMSARLRWSPTPATLPGQRGWRTTPKR